MQFSQSNPTHLSRTRATGLGFVSAETSIDPIRPPSLPSSAKSLQLKARGVLVPSPGAGNIPLIHVPFGAWAFLSRDRIRIHHSMSILSTHRRSSDLELVVTATMDTMDSVLVLHNVFHLLKPRIALFPGCLVWEATLKTVLILIMDIPDVEVHRLSAGEFVVALRRYLPVLVVSDMSWTTVHRISKLPRA